MNTTSTAAAATRTSRLRADEVQIGDLVGLKIMGTTHPRFFEVAVISQQKRTTRGGATVRTVTARAEDGTWLLANAAPHSKHTVRRTGTQGA